MKNIVVLYHKNCSSGDGFGAAWVAWKKFGNSAEYIGINHQDFFPKLLKNKEVYMVDISYEKPNMQILLKTCKKVVVLDHHESVEGATKMATEYRYDVKKSGATLSWGYFFPNKKVPKLLKYLEYVDLWKFTLPYTNEIIASVHSYDRNFNVWDKLIRDIENKESFLRHRERGEAILKYQEQLIDKAIEDAEDIEFMGYKAKALNSSVLRDKISDRLYSKKYPFVIVWHYIPGKIAVSLRSIPSFDVTKIAMKFGGGGHKNSSGFVLPTNKPFPWKIIKK